MSAYTGKHDDDGLTDQQRDVVAASLRGIGSPAEAHPEMGAIVWMFGVGLVAIVCAVIFCGPALWAFVGGGS